MIDNSVGEEYKKLFKSEVISYLDNLNNLVVELEKHPERKDVIDEIFRIFHTIKSMAGTMGYEEMAQLCHRIEDLLFPVRNGEEKVSQNLIDEILDGIDFIENFIYGEKKTINRLKITLNKDTPLPGARFFTILNNLKTITDVELLEPGIEELTGEEDIFQFVISTDYPEKVREELRKYSEVEKIELLVEEEKEHVVKDESKKPRELRVDIEDLDALQNILAELVITRERLKELIKERGDADLNSAMEFHSRAISDLQDIVMKIRMVPLSHIFDRFPRYVRDLAKNLGKKINLKIIGSDIELDRSLIESISDPLHHLVRNAVDHGIEPPEVRKRMGKNEEGTIEIKASREKGFIKITISDDGSGIDTENIKIMALKKGLIKEEQAGRLSERELISFLFLPGFSTREEVSDLSGRGVGLDVVREAMRKIGGNVELHSVQGKGTTINLYIPLTMAIIKAYIIRVENEFYAIPLTFLIETTSVDKNRVSFIHGKPLVILRNEVMPLYDLRKILALKERNGDETDMPTLVLNVEGKRFILLTDELITSGDIVVKHLPVIIRDIRQYTGVTIMGDGYPCLILDVPNLVQ